VIEREDKYDAHLYIAAEVLSNSLCSTSAARPKPRGKPELAWQMSVIISRIDDF
jgi:hypothetical protein